MRWTLRIGALLGVLLIAYTIWPFVDLYRLGRAIERRDALAVASRVELRVLRPSISKQVLATYLRLTGSEARLGSGIARDFIVGAGVAMVDGALAETLTIERLLDLLSDGLGSAALGADLNRKLDFVPRNLSSLWRLYAGSEYRLADFHVSVPPDLPLKDRFKIRLRLTQWTWKLHDIELPEDMRVRLAEELIKQRGRP